MNGGAAAAARVVPDGGRPPVRPVEGSSVAGDGRESGPKRVLVVSDRADVEAGNRPTVVAAERILDAVFHVATFVVEGIVISMGDADVG